MCVSRRFYLEVARVSQDKIAEKVSTILLQTHTLSHTRCGRTVTLVVGAGVETRAGLSDTACGHSASLKPDFRFSHVIMEMGLTRQN